MANWISASTLPINFSDGGAVVYNNKIHILYGTNHYAWDGTSWTSQSTMPYSFVQSNAVVYDNKIHILGGTSYESNHYAWDGTSWTSVSDMPYRFSKGCVIVYDNKIHILGGGASTTYYKYHYAWDGTSWSQVSTLPMDNYYGTAVVYNNKINLFLGPGHYTLSGSTWTLESELPYSIEYGSSVVFKDRMWIIGGEDIPLDPERSLNLYYYDGSQWVNDSPLPYNFNHGDAVVYDDKIHILGSPYSSGYSTNHYKISIAVNKVIFGDETLIDLTSDTIAPEYLLQGYTAHDKSGVQISGSYVPPVVPVSDLKCIVGTTTGASGKQIDVQCDFTPTLIYIYNKTNAQTSNTCQLFYSTYSSVNGTAKAIINYASTTMAGVYFNGPYANYPSGKITGTSVKFYTPTNSTYYTGTWEYIVCGS